MFLDTLFDPAFRILRFRPGASLIFPGRFHYVKFTRGNITWKSG